MRWAYGQNGPEMLQSKCGRLFVVIQKTLSLKNKSTVLENDGL